MERIVIGLLAVPGLLISAYFSSVYHNLVRDVDRYVPRLCRMESGACDRILETPQARLFALPNFDLGILYYTSLLGSAFLPSLWKQLHLMLFLGSVVTVATGFYLTYVLAFRLHVRCTLCLISHVVNFLIFLVLLAGV